jgi:hypothetical protein
MTEHSGQFSGTLTDSTQQETGVFDPNKQAQRQHPRTGWNYDWATYVPTRRPMFKIHATCGHATAACKDKAVYAPDPLGYLIPEDVKLYQRVDGLWEEVAIRRELPLKHNINILTGEKQ